MRARVDLLQGAQSLGPGSSAWRSSPRRPPFAGLLSRELRLLKLWVSFSPAPDVSDGDCASLGHADDKDGDDVFSGMALALGGRVPRTAWGVVLVGLATEAHRREAGVAY